jgi:hypothetical protein
MAIDYGRPPKGGFAKLVSELLGRYGDREGGKREVIVLDPNGYLIMFAEDLGERSL